MGLFGVENLKIIAIKEQIRGSRGRRLFGDLLLASLFFFFFFPHGLLWHIEIPRLGVQLELRLQVFATVMATSDPSYIFD